MSEPTVQQVFGTLAYQSPGDLVISKEDLAAVGLTVKSENTAEGLLIGILAKARIYLNEEKAKTDHHIQVTIEPSIESIVDRSFGKFRKRVFTINLYQPYVSAFDPDNY